MAKEGYFGDNSVNPSFLTAGKPHTKSDFADPTALKSAESAALDQPSTDIKTAEKNPSFYYTGKRGGGASRGPAVPSSKARRVRMGDTTRQDPRSGSGSRQDPRKGKLKGKRRGLPLIVSLLLFGAGGFAIMSSNSLLGPHISSLTTSSTNIGRTAVSRTENKLLSWLSEKNLLPKSLQQRFVKNGATSATASTIEYKGQTLSGADIAKTANTDLEFSDVVNNSTRSNVLDFHDTSANQTYSHLSQTRNIFSDYKSTGNSETDQANYTALRTEAAGADSANVRLNTAEDVQRTDPETGEAVLDEQGNPIIDRTSTGSDLSAKTTDGADATSKAKTFLSGAAAKVASGVNATCALWQVGNMVSLAVSAAELYQSINYFHNTIESVSKMMAGEGEASGVNETMNFFTTPTTQKVWNPTTGEEISTTGSPLQSEWARVVLGGVTANTNNSTLYSFERIGRTALSVFGTVFTSRAAASACHLSRAAAAAISLGTIATGGIIGGLIGGLLNTALRIGITIAISGALAALIPIVAKAIFTNSYTAYESGIPAGEEFGRGAMASNSRISRSSSGLTLASEENVTAYMRYQNETIAREAALDRYRHSPFDASSPNTFLGTIAKHFAFTPIFNNNSLLANITSGNLYSIASTISNATTSSLYANVSADGNFTNYYNTYGDCPYQKDIGGACEMYDNSLYAADPSIFDLTPDDPTYKSVLAPSLTTDENGNEKIKDNSPLAQFITYYLDRDSIEGVYDVNIEKSCQSSLGVVGDNLPIINDIIDLVNTAEAESCADVATGERYIYSSSNPRWDSEIKYYQYYVLQNRVLDRFGYYEEQGTKSPVVAYRENYEAEHPLDNSRSGTLARISGISKDDATTVLALVDYYEAVAEYDATEAYNFLGENSSDSTSVAMKFSTEFSTSENIILLSRNYLFTRKEDFIS